MRCGEEKVIAVTVTYNDAVLLLKCVEALLGQKYPVSRVVVVDNNSDKRNKQLLKTITDEKIDILTMNENLGGAGGFEAGMKHVVKQYDFDWIWIMDADAFPRTDCLEKLLKHKDDRENIGYLAPLIFGVNLQRYQLHHHKKLARFLYRDLPLYSSFEEIPDISNVAANAFVGPLFSKRAIKELGVADGSLFIYGDDLEYTYRVTRKYSAFLVKEAIINHRDQPDANGTHEPEKWWKDYYTFRNRILFIRKFEKHALNRFVGEVLVVLRVVKQSVLCLGLPENNALKKVRLNIIWSGYKDGLNGKTGKTVDPGTFASKVRSIREHE